MDLSWLTRPDNLIANSLLWSPLAFAGLLGLAAVLIWMAFAPASPAKAVEERLSGYLERPDPAAGEMARPFVVRAVLPLFRGAAHGLGRLLPQRNVAATTEMLVQAGEPGGLSAIDFLGLRVLLAVLLPVGYFLLAAGGLDTFTLLRNILALVLAGFLVPLLWLRMRVNQRRSQITRALPDALDMLTIGVEAGQAFETALVKVGDKWHNELTKEFRRAVREMRVGTPRDEALQRMAKRTGADDVEVFVAVLVQSTQLGVSIAQVLHSQAAEMRTKRRQRAEELARQASVKLVFPLVICIMPALFAVILGPAVPSFMSFFAALGGR